MFSLRAALPFFSYEGKKEKKKIQSVLQLCDRESKRAGEQISLIDGYKMLRTELQAQQARASEWNGVHS